MIGKGFNKRAVIRGINVDDLPTREQAEKTGQRYYMGEACKRGHLGARYTSNGACIDCHKLHPSYRRAEAKSLGTSKAVAIDHILDEREKDYWDDM